MTSLSEEGRPARPDDGPPRRRPTMRDVARVAGVSVKTVSRVVNGEPVNQEMTDRVWEGVNLLGFRRNDAASNLRRGTSTATVGLIVEDVGNPFYSLLGRGVEEVATRHGALLISGSAEESGAREQELALALCSRRVDGLLIVPSGDRHQYLLPEIHQGLPVVFVGRPAGDIDADVVLVDNAGGMREAVGHLRGRGHRRIALLADDPGIFTTRERLHGFTTALADAGQDEDLIVTGPHDDAAVAAAVRTWAHLGAPPTAIVTDNNRLTVRLLRALDEHPSWRPELVGFDDVELADFLVHRLSTVDQDPRAMGRAAVELLFRRIDGERGPAERIVMPTRLIAR